MRQFWDVKFQSAQFKEMTYINPFLGIVFNYFCAYAKEHDLPVVITSISRPAPGRIPNSPHNPDPEHGVRAVDISSRHWSELHIHRIRRKINKVYRDWGTAPYGKPPQALVYHDAGTGPHFHLQVKRNIKLDQ